MFELILALVLIVVLYYKTVGYCHLIDDIVPMKDYLYVIPATGPQPGFYLSKPHISKRLWAIFVHMFTTFMVYLILGGKAALLFAVFPINVNNVAWITGSYYSTTAMMTLISYYFVVHIGGALGIAAGMVAFATALNCTIATIAFPFVFLFGNPIGLTMLFPLGMFLIGKRFTVGVKIRKNLIKDEHAIPDVFTPIRLVVCIKVIAQYIYLSFMPIRLCFFHFLGNRFLVNKEHRDMLQAIDKHFLASVALILAFIGLGWVTGNFFWAMWFLVLIAAFSQFKILGQFFAERYMYPAVVGFVAILAALPEPFYWILVGMYVARTYFFVPVFANNGALYENGTKQEPAEACNYVNLSDWYLVCSQNLQLAAFNIDRALALDPEDFKSNLNKSTLWIFLKNWPEAIKECDIAIEKARKRVALRFVEVIENQKKNCQGMIDAENKKTPAA